MRTHNPLHTRSKYHNQFVKVGFDPIFDLTATWIVLDFSNNPQVSSIP